MYENITPYYAAQVTNMLLEQSGSDRKITPQMMYSYAKKKTIATTTDSKGKIYFVGDEFKKWLDKYLAGGATKTKQDINKLADMYA